MSYIPLSVLKAAIGSEANGFTKLLEYSDRIVFDKQALVDILAEKAVVASVSESLIDLINRVDALQVNFNLQYTELFPGLLDSLLDGADAQLYPATIETAQDAILSPSVADDESGNLWLSGKWNAVLSGNNTPAQYVASASSEETGFEAYKAFNNTNATSSDCWLTATGNVTGYVQYQDTVAGAVVIEYWMTSRNAGSGPSEAPRDWTFQGSNDGTNWTTLDTRSGITWTQNEQKKFYFLNSTSYSYYRLNVTANNGSVNFVAVGELELRSNPSGTVSF